MFGMVCIRHAKPRNFIRFILFAFRLENLFNQTIQNKKYEKPLEATIFTAH